MTATIRELKDRLAAIKANVQTSNESRLAATEASSVTPNRLLHPQHQSNNPSSPVQDGEGIGLQSPPRPQQLGWGSGPGLQSALLQRMVAERSGQGAVKPIEEEEHHHDKLHQPLVSPKRRSEGPTHQPQDEVVLLDNFEREELIQRALQGEKSKRDALQAVVQMESLMSDQAKQSKDLEKEILDLKKEHDAVLVEKQLQIANLEQKNKILEEDVKRLQQNSQKRENEGTMVQGALKDQMHTLEEKLAAKILLLQEEEAENQKLRKDHLGLQELVAKLKADIVKQQQEHEMHLQYVMRKSLQNSENNDAEGPHSTVSMVARAEAQTNTSPPMKPLSHPFASPSKSNPSSPDNVASRLNNIERILTRLQFEQDNSQAGQRQVHDSIKQLHEQMRFQQQSTAPVPYKGTSSLESPYYPATQRTAMPSSVRSVSGANLMSPSQSIQKY